MNKEFQDLKAQWGKNSAERANIIEKMRENLKSRNDGKNTYSFGFTIRGKVLNIDTCSAPERTFCGECKNRKNDICGKCRISSLKICGEWKF